MNRIRVFKRRALFAAPLFLAGCLKDPANKATLLLDVSSSAKLNDRQRLDVALTLSAGLKGAELAIIPINATNANWMSLTIPKDPTGYGDVFKEEVYDELEKRLPPLMQEWQSAGANMSNYLGALEIASALLESAKEKVLVVIGDLEHDVDEPGGKRTSVRRKVNLSQSDLKSLSLSGVKVFVGGVPGNANRRPSDELLEEWRALLVSSGVTNPRVSKHGLDEFPHWAKKELQPPPRAFAEWRQQKEESREKTQAHVSK